jgi:hypothetical protein
VFESLRGAVLVDRQFGYECAQPLNTGRRVDDVGGMPQRTSSPGAAVDDALKPCGLWTDRDGVVHIRAAGTGRTYCDVAVGAYTAARPVIGCDRCVAVSIADYARHHDCREPKSCGEAWGEDGAA